MTRYLRLCGVKPRLKSVVWSAELQRALGLEDVPRLPEPPGG
jgi:hypothetical protein